MLSPSDRHDLLKSYIRSGSATVDQLLELSFGEWPPKGLDIVVPNDQTVKLITRAGDVYKQESGNTVIRLFRTAGTFLAFGGMAFSGDDRVVFLNPTCPFVEDGLCNIRNLFRGHRSSSLIGPSTLIAAHETAHVLQYDHNNLQRAAEIFGKDEARKISQFRTWADHYFVGHFRRDQRAVKAFVRKYTGVTAGLGNGDEIQARIHEIMVDGYGRWGRLPGTTPELWTAMIDAGVKAPKQIVRDLKASPRYRETRSVFSGGSSRIIEAATDINNVLRTFRSDSLDDIWRVSLVQSYANLLEMYGDKFGKGRFGLGENYAVKARLAWIDQRDQMMPSSKAVPAIPKSVAVGLGVVAHAL